jgi:hypothetical protein
MAQSASLMDLWRISIDQVTVVVVIVVAKASIMHVKIILMPQAFIQNIEERMQDNDKWVKENIYIDQEKWAKAFFFVSPNNN